MKNFETVYSTNIGRICPSCKQAISNCICKNKKKNIFTGDGVVRVKREAKGRKGKVVTIISGLSQNEDDFTAFAKQLKQKCAAGGSAKDGLIIIQGDHCNLVISEIKKAGFIVKRSGG